MKWGPGRLLFIHIARAASEDMKELPAAELIEGKGIKGDRYFNGTGQYSHKDLEGLRWLPDGGAIRVPDPIHHREPFVIEAWWLAAPDRLERMERVYDANGAWQCSRCLTLERTC